MVALYRNDGDRFTDVTAATGLTRLGWGSGVCVADYDNDGFEDVYVTAYGPNVLWRNIGGRSFVATTQARDPRWSTGCAFGDYDRDGDVDLFVANFVRFVPGKVPKRGERSSCRFENIDVFCGPRGLPGEPDALYRNEGNGTFTDVTKATSTVEPGYYGFGVLFSDLDDDGWPDIYVANDSTPNLFFHNRRDGTFSERALQSGLAVSADGREQAGMGVDAGDVDGDGRLDLVKTNFAQDYTSLYLNQGDALFVDSSIRSGLAADDGAVPRMGRRVRRRGQRRPARPLHRQRSRVSRRRADRHEHVPSAQPAPAKRRPRSVPARSRRRSADHCSSSSRAAAPRSAMSTTTATSTFWCQSSTTVRCCCATTRPAATGSPCGSRVCEAIGRRSGRRS